MIAPLRDRRNLFTSPICHARFLDRDAVTDLFLQYAQKRHNEVLSLDYHDVHNLLQEGFGE